MKWTQDALYRYLCMTIVLRDETKILFGYRYDRGGKEVYHVKPHVPALLLPEITPVLSDLSPESLCAWLNENGAALFATGRR